MTKTWQFHHCLGHRVDYIFRRFFVAISIERWSSGTVCAAETEWSEDFWGIIRVTEGDSTNGCRHLWAVGGCLWTPHRTGVDRPKYMNTKLNPNKTHPCPSVKKCQGSKFWYIYSGMEATCTPRLEGKQTLPSQSWVSGKEIRWGEIL